MTGPASAKGADVVYIIPRECQHTCPIFLRSWLGYHKPVHCPSFSPLVFRMAAIEAGGSPMTLPEKAPNMMTKAIAVLAVLVNVHMKKQSSEEAKVTTKCTFSALYLVSRKAEPMRPIVEEAFMMA